MSFNVLPKEKTEVVIRTEKYGNIFSAFFSDGFFFVIIEEGKTISYDPSEVDRWFYSKDLFNIAIEMLKNALQ